MNLRIGGLAGSCEVDILDVNLNPVVLKKYGSAGKCLSNPAVSEMSARSGELYYSC